MEDQLKSERDTSTAERRNVPSQRENADKRHLSRQSTIFSAGDSPDPLLC
jgi:hypothetical protein